MRVCVSVICTKDPAGHQIPWNHSYTVVSSHVFSGNQTQVL